METPHPPTNLCSGVPERSCGGSQVRGEVSTRGCVLGSAAHWLLSVGGGLFLFPSHKVVVGVVSVTLRDVGTCVRGLLLEATFKMALQGREVLKFRWEGTGREKGGKREAVTLWSTIHCTQLLQHRVIIIHSCFYPPRPLLKWRDWLQYVTCTFKGGRGWQVKVWPTKYKAVIYPNMCCSLHTYVHVASLNRTAIPLVPLVQQRY